MMMIKRKMARWKRNIKKAPLSAYVVFSLSMIIVFTIVMLIFFAKYQMIPDQLVICWYSCFSGEVLCASLIKIFKISKGDNDNE